MTTAYGIGQRKSEQRIKLGTIKLATLKRKEEELIEVMKMRDLCILALVGTGLNGKGDRTIYENYRLMYSGGEGSRYGVGCPVSDNLASYVQKINCVSERLIGKDMKLGTGVSLLQVYAPQQGSKEEQLLKKKSFTDSYKKLLIM